MLEKQFTMPLSRLARYLKNSRDNWKEKALLKQKKLRTVEQKVRDLEKSREKWKKRAKEAEKEIRKLKEEREENKKEEKSRSSEKKEKKPKGHHYTVKTIQISMKQIIESGNSYRGVEKTLKLLSEDMTLDSPHRSSIRKWVGRVGLYELEREREKREDWVFIVDLTLELGAEKAMVIYGISLQKYQEEIVREKRGLKHSDGEILMIEITASAPGEYIEEKLEELSEKVGIPQQIISDRGSNVKKGISLYQEKHPEVISTYDVTHGMSNLIKQELSEEESYQKFLKECHQCRLQLQQTELAFLMPPSQRSQCRYFNVERLVNWGRKLLNTPSEIILGLMPQADIKEREERLNLKLSWLKNYKESLEKWETMLFLTRTLENQLKTQGLWKDSCQVFENQVSSQIIPPNLQKFKEKIIKYIQEETQSLKTEKSLIATTDVLESIFGKYKYFSSRCPLKELRIMLLTIPLYTIALTKDIIQKALETIRGVDLAYWEEQMFGVSMLSKRKTLFSCPDE